MHAAARDGQEENGVDCRMWPPGQQEEWIGAGGVVELSKVTNESVVVSWDVDRYLIHPHPPLSPPGAQSH